MPGIDALAVFLVLSAFVIMVWVRLRFIILSRDPIQQQLAGELAEAADIELASRDDLDASAGIFLYVMSQGWPKNKAIRRLRHASTLLRASKIIPYPIQIRGAEIANRTIKKFN
jgi:hypothetical protein